MDHNIPADVEPCIREAALDETIADSFPASDPPSTIPNPNDGSLTPAPGCGDDEEAPARRDSDLSRG